MGKKRKRRGQGTLCRQESASGSRNVLLAGSDAKARCFFFFPPLSCHRLLLDEHHQQMDGAYLVLRTISTPAVAAPNPGSATERKAGANKGGAVAVARKKGAAQSSLRDNFRNGWFGGGGVGNDEI